MDLNHRFDAFRRHRQTLLGSSAQGKLIISNFHGLAPVGRHLPEDAKSEAFILRLPDEILIIIFELATSAKFFSGCLWNDRVSWTYTTSKILALTCHRFNRIALPLIYHQISLSYPNRIVPPTKATKILHHSLHKNISLRQYCQFLSLHISDVGHQTRAEHFSIATDLASWLTKIHCLNIHGGFDPKHNAHTWALIRKIVQHMREIEHLHISREGFGLELQPIFDSIEIPSLRKLEIHGLSETKERTIILQPEKYRTAQFTTLWLSDYEESPWATVQLLQWPKEIFHFKFGSFYNNRHYMDLPMLHSMLSIHRDTLKTLAIGYLSRSDHKALFKAVDFPNLEGLELSRWQMSKALESPASDADLLLAPKLKTFKWDFSIYDQHSEAWTDFGDTEENWLRGFLKAAISRKTMLKEVNVTFNPDDWEVKEEFGYPWDRMDAICEEFQPFGVKLRYSEPCMTKAAWLERMKSLGQEEEDTEISATIDAEVNLSESGCLEQDESESIFEGRDIREYFPLIQKGDFDLNTESS